MVWKLLENGYKTEKKICNKLNSIALYVPVITKWKLFRESNFKIMSLVNIIEYSYRLVTICKLGGNDSSRLL